MNELQKWLLWKLGRRRFTPIPFGKKPMFSQTVPDIGDTGGGGWYRPPYRMQDPSKDPKEPYGSESSGTGNDHGWSNCTMSAGAMAMGFATNGDKVPWGGDIRHHQSDLSGGTDLNDLDQAFASYGENFTIKSGTGWDDVQKYRKEGRAIVIQGQGNVPGSETFDGGHACVIHPEVGSDASKWLFGDPLATGWQWVTESSIKSWAQAWNSSISFGITDANKPAPPPDPEPEEPPVSNPNPAPAREVCTPDRKVSHTMAERHERNRREDEEIESWLEFMAHPSEDRLPATVSDALQIVMRGSASWDESEWRRAKWADVEQAPNAGHFDESLWESVPVPAAAWALP